MIITERIENLIHLVRGQRVMLDADLAALYGVTTKALVQAVKRNRERFPEDFMSQLTDREFMILRSQIVTSKTGEGRGGRRSSPYAFTEKYDSQFKVVFDAIRHLMEPDQRRIGFHRE